MILKKICICNSCFICEDCLELCNINKVTKCGLCRRDLNFINTYNYCNIFLKFFYLYNIIIFISVIYFSYPIYNLVINNYDYKSRYYFLIFLFFSLFIDINNCYFLIKIFNFNLVWYQVLRSLVTITTYLILFVVKYNTPLSYIYFILIPHYIVPQLVLFTLMLVKKLSHNLDLLYTRCCKKTIKFRLKENNFSENNIIVFTRV